MGCGSEIFDLRYNLSVYRVGAYWLGDFILVYAVMTSFCLHYILISIDAYILTSYHISFLKQTSILGSELIE